MTMYYFNVLIIMHGQLFESVQQAAFTVRRLLSVISPQRIWMIKHCWHKCCQSACCYDLQGCILCYSSLSVLAVIRIIWHLFDSLVQIRPLQFNKVWLTWLCCWTEANHYLTSPEKKHCSVCQCSSTIRNNAFVLVYLTGTMHKKLVLHQI